MTNRGRNGEKNSIYSNGPSAIDQTVGTLEVAVRVKMTLMKIFHSFSDVSHE